MLVIKPRSQCAERDLHAIESVFEAAKFALITERPDERGDRHGGNGEDCCDYIKPFHRLPPLPVETSMTDSVIPRRVERQCRVRTLPSSA